MSTLWASLPEINFDEPPKGGGDERKSKTSAGMLRMCEDLGVSPFLDADSGVVYGHVGSEIVPLVRAREFEAWLTSEWHRATGSPPSKGDIDETVRLLEARAFLEPPVKTFVRRAEKDGKIYLDLGKSVVEVGPGGWQVIERPPVLFRRPQGLLPLPDPEPGGSLEALRPFFRVDDDDFITLVFWLLSTMSDGPYPVLVLRSEHGSGKSTAMTILKSLIDPDAAPKRSAPRDEDAVFSAALNHHVVSFDNLSGINRDLSDSFCRLATGGGISKRRLYTDADEWSCNVKRPVVVNGITVSLDRPDLLSRSVIVGLQTIPETQRTSETAIMAAFDRERPKILGALLTAVSGALKESNHRVLGLGRMADAEAFAVRAERAGCLPWPEGTVQAILRRRRAEAEEDAIAGDPVAALVVGLESWSGPLKDLLRKLLDPRTTEERRYLPQSERALGGALDRLTPLLRNQGIEVKRERTWKGYKVHIQSQRSGRSATFRPQSVMDTGSMNVLNVMNVVSDFDGNFSEKSQGAPVEFERSSLVKPENDVHNVQDVHQASDIKGSEPERPLNVADSNGPTFREPSPPPRGPSQAEPFNCGEQIALSPEKQIIELVRRQEPGETISVLAVCREVPDPPLVEAVLAELCDSGELKHEHDGPLGSNPTFLVTPVDTLSTPHRHPLKADEHKGGADRVSRGVEEVSTITTDRPFDRSPPVELNQDWLEEQPEFIPPWEYAETIETED